MWYSKSKSASASKSFKKEPLQKGQYRFLRDENIFGMCFHDKKEIYFLSTIHSMEEVARGKSGKDGRSVKIMRLISDYNKHIRREVMLVRLYG